jgi:peptide/nickel transport system permease protein
VSYAPPLSWATLEDARRRAQASSAVRRLRHRRSLGTELAEIRASLTGAKGPEAKRAAAVRRRQVGSRRAQEGTQGTEVSLFVGITAACLTALLGTLFGALAGYFGGWVDDVFNWIYSVFTSIPYLLLVLAIAAVLGTRASPP